MKPSLSLDQCSVLVFRYFYLKHAMKELLPYALLYPIHQKMFRNGCANTHLYEKFKRSLVNFDIKHH